MAQESKSNNSAIKPLPETTILTWPTINECECDLLDNRTHKPWPKLDMDEREFEMWIQRCIPKASNDLYAILCKEFGRVIPDKNDFFWIIERFVFCKESKLIEYVRFLINKGYEVTISGRQLWRSLEWARNVTQTTRTRRKVHNNVYDDILGQTAIQCRYSSDLNKEDLQYYISYYIKKHPNALHGKLNPDKTMYKDEIEQAQANLPSALKTNCILQNLDTYIEYKPRTSERGMCAVCTSIFLMKLNIKISAINDSEYVDFNCGLVRDCTLKPLSHIPKPLINAVELTECVQELTDQKQENHVCTGLLAEYTKIKNTEENYEKEQQKLKNTIGDSHNDDSWWLRVSGLNDSTKIQQANYIEDCFLFMTETVIHHYNTLNEKSPVKSKMMAHQVLDHFTIQIHNSVKKIKRRFFNSSVFVNLNFYLSCLWADTYNKKELMNIHILFTDVTVRNVPVSSAEIIHWSIVLNGFLDHKATGKDGTAIDYKKWLEDGIMCDILIQITDYMFKYLRKIKSYCLNDAGDEKE